MAELVADCPRCAVKNITFDCSASVPVGKQGWIRKFEAFAVCRHCRRSSIFRVGQSHPRFDQFFDLPGFTLQSFEGCLNNIVNVEGHVSLSDQEASPPPEYLPQEIDAIFREAARCKAVNCFNAAGAIYRLCLDLATRSMLPPENTEGGPNSKERRDLGLRLPWLFENGRLPNELRNLSHCIREDGNDGAHAGNLKEADAEDMHDFTFALPERLFTEPERLRLAQERRDKRRANP